VGTRQKGWRKSARILPFVNFKKNVLSEFCAWGKICDWQPLGVPLERDGAEVGADAEEPLIVCKVFHFCINYSSPGQPYRGGSLCLPLRKSGCTG
jgi:hypothetical protein